jgi:hypothetical protein
MASTIYVQNIGYRAGYSRVQITTAYLFETGNGTLSVTLANILMVISIIFLVIGYGTIQYNKLAWISGIAWFVFYTVVSLIPPPSLIILPIVVVGLYWASRGRTADFEGSLLDIIPVPTIGIRPTDSYESPRNSGSIFRAIMWMSLVSIILFWLPLFGPLISGCVGGWVAGSISRGVVAAILPAVIAGISLFLLATSLNLPVIGAMLGGAIIIAVVAHSSVLIMGAMIGGLLVNRTP